MTQWSKFILKMYPPNIYRKAQRQSRVVMKDGKPHKPVQPKRAVRGVTWQLESWRAVMEAENQKTRYELAQHFKTKVKGSGCCIFSWFRALHYH